MEDLSMQPLDPMNKSDRAYLLLPQSLAARNTVENSTSGMDTLDIKSELSNNDFRF